MKATTIETAIERYGHIDFPAAHWPLEASWMVMSEVPPGFFPNWKVLGTQMPVKHIYCNIDMRWPLLQALDAVHSRGLGSELKTFDGCFKIRMVRGSESEPSAHSYGLAIDINAADNQLGSAGNLSSELVKCFTDFGFDWGGGFHSRKDPMHFSFCWE